MSLDELKLKERSHKIQQAGDFEPDSVENMFQDHDHNFREIRAELERIYTAIATINSTLADHEQRIYDLENP